MQTPFRKVRSPTAITAYDAVVIILIFTLLIGGHTLAYGVSLSPTIGELQLHDNGGTSSPALLENTDIQIRVEGMLARVEVNQTFRNDTSFWVEGEYLFPLSNRGAVDYMEMTIGQRHIVGKIREKQAARKIYEEAKQQGRKASLVSQQRPNMFTNRVANIAPGETIQVKLRYIDIPSYERGQFTLRLPTTLTPRYNPAAASYRDATGVGIDETPNNIYTATETASSLTLRAYINSGVALADVESVHHAANVVQTSTGYAIELAPDAALDRDVVLQWSALDTLTPTTVAFTETIDNQHYLMLQLLPPQQNFSATTLPRETIFVIDTSGSMGGVAIRQAQAALLVGISQLEDNDRFNIIQFNSATSTLWTHAVEASFENREIAKSYVNHLQANGGTEMASALKTAFSDRAPAGYVRQVIFMTDSSVGNESALFELIHRQKQDSRLFTVGIGSAPNSHFMEKAATTGRGSFTYIGSQDEITSRMTELFQKLESPVLTDISIQFDSEILLISRTDTAASDRKAQVEMFPHVAPDLYLGEPLLLTAKFAHTLPKSLTVTGKLGNSAFQQQINLSTLVNSPDVSKLWARKKLSALYDVENQARFNGDNELADDFKSEITKLAIFHQLLSKYTSFVAIEELQSRSFNEFLQKLVVPNTMPAGTTMAVPVPRGGLGLMQYWLTAAMCLLALLLLYCFSYFVKRHSAI